MPAAFPGNSTTKLARSDGAGGFESAIETVVSGTPAISSVTDNGSTLTITGSNFGSKTQAAPVLHDIGGNAWENGTLNSLIADLTDGATIPDTTDDPSSPYLVATSNAILNKQAARFTGGAAYEFVGEQGWIGTPKAYGGLDTPPATERTVLAFWLERKWHWQYYRISPTTAVTGTFQPGENVTVLNSTHTGRFIDVETFATDPDLYHFELTSRLSGSFEGKTIRGDTSGAEIVFPTEFRGGSGTGFETAGTKYVRVSDNANTDFLVGIFTPNDAWVRSNQNLFDYTRAYPQLTQSEEAPDTANLYEWEMFLDTATSQGLSRVFFNGKLKDEQTYDATNGFDPNQSLVFTLLGNDAHETFQRTRLHEVYFDSAFQRVYLGDASTWDACTKVELQRPTAWAGDSITAAKHEGALTGNKWVYVRGPDGSINQNGAAV